LPIRPLRCRTQREAQHSRDVFQFHRVWFD
jgi:hypothetical protein